MRFVVSGCRRTTPFASVEISSFLTASSRLPLSCSTCIAALSAVAVFCGAIMLPRSHPPPAATTDSPATAAMVTIGEPDFFGTSSSLAIASAMVALVLFGAQMGENLSTTCWPTGGFWISLSRPRPP